MPRPSASANWRRRPKAPRKPQILHQRLKNLPLPPLRSSALPSCRRNAPGLSRQGNLRLRAVLRYLAVKLGPASREVERRRPKEGGRVWERPARPLRTNAWWLLSHPRSQRPKPRLPLGMIDIARALPTIGGLEPTMTATLFLNAQSSTMKSRAIAPRPGPHTIERRKRWPRRTRRNAAIASHLSSALLHRALRHLGTTIPSLVPCLRSPRETQRRFSGWLLP